MQGYIKEFDCTCGKRHVSTVEDIIVERGAIARVPEFVKKYGGKKPFVIADKNTFKACGEAVLETLKKADISYESFIFNKDVIKPEEQAIGSLVMHFNRSCDIIIAVGSGVINDVSKVLASLVRLSYIVVATAPSMDGYASATSSVNLDGRKISLPTKCADVIIGDLNVLKNAPKKMMLSGLGDMLAKIISICEWRLANLIVGEYYCERIASLIRNAVKQCIDNADGLLKGDEKAVEAVFNGLVMGGVAMAYAENSRPASGVEHYFSHVWDMRALEFNTPYELHGLQCAVGTLYAIKIYEQIVNMTPNEEKALSYVRTFDQKKNELELKNFLGKGAETLIEQDKKERKADAKKHEERIKIICSKWQEILAIIREELISSKSLIALMDKLKMPKTCEDLGIDKSTLRQTFFTTKEIRDKYVLSRLCWDLGVLEEVEIK